MEDLASIIWGELKGYINLVERREAAENLVNILIDNDCDPEDIKTAFKGDSDIKEALLSYLDNNQLEEDDELEEEDEDYDQEWDE